MKLSGPQKAEQNVASFDTWLATQTDDDFKQMVWRGQLNRGDLAKAVGCGKSALNQNPDLRLRLKLLEERLRRVNVLPPLSSKAARNGSAEPKQYDYTANKRILDSKRVSTLEQENIELKVKVKELETKLKRYGELSETLAEIGLMPR